MSGIHYIACLSLLFTNLSAFHVYETGPFVENENKRLLKVPFIRIDDEFTYNEFPNTFVCSLSVNAIGKAVNLRFRLNNEHDSSDDKVYTINGPTIKEFLQSNHKKHKHFSEVNGRAIATLILDDGFKSNITTNEMLKFKIIITIFPDENGNSYSIIPIILSNTRRKRDLSDNSNEHHHAIYKRNDNIQFGRDYIIHPKLKTENLKKHKRTVSSKPIDLYIELLVVTDYSVFLTHQAYANTTNTTLVFLHMKMYFSHVIYGNLVDSNWTNSQYVGIPTVPTYKNREVIVTTSTLNAFTKYVNSLNLPFAYDHAIGLFNKDLWSDSGSAAQTRSGTVGFSSIGQICTDNRYSIEEEIGGFSSIQVIAHEIGHNLGSFHDGESLANPLAGACNASNNFIMTPSIGVFQDNLTNLFIFSNCSILQFKQNLLLSDKSDVTQDARCLLNVPMSLPSEAAAYVETGKGSGAIWTADDQCRMAFGKNASFCHNGNSDICTTLRCRRSLDNLNCYYTAGIGASDKTPCSSGKSCSFGECVDDLTAPTGSCIYGDDYVSSFDFDLSVTLQEPLLTCTDAISYLNSINKDFVFYCKTTELSFKSSCCRTCEIYQSIDCVDTIATCSNFASFCQTPGITLNGADIKVTCAYTCGACTRVPFGCTNNIYVCLNGGSCLNKTITDPYSLIGFSCQCPSGYYGDYCELRNYCEPNPCENSGACVSSGSNGYACLCQDYCSGYNCETCTSVPSTSSQTSTIDIATSSRVTDTTVSTSSILTSKSSTNTISTSTISTSKTTTMISITGTVSTLPTITTSTSTLKTTITTLNSITSYTSQSTVLPTISLTSSLSTSNSTIISPISRASSVATTMSTLTAVMRSTISTSTTISSSGRPSSSTSTSLPSNTINIDTTVTVSSTSATLSSSSKVPSTTFTSIKTSSPSLIMTSQITTTASSYSGSTLSSTLSSQTKSLTNSSWMSNATTTSLISVTSLASRMSTLTAVMRSTISTSTTISSSGRPSSSTSTSLPSNTINIDTTFTVSSTSATLSSSSKVPSTTFTSINTLITTISYITTTSSSSGFTTLSSQKSTTSSTTQQSTSTLNVATLSSTSTMETLTVSFISTQSTVTTTKTSDSTTTTSSSRSSSTTKPTTTSSTSTNRYTSTTTFSTLSSSATSLTTWTTISLYPSLVTLMTNSSTATFTSTTISTALPSKTSTKNSASFSTSTSTLTTSSTTTRSTTILSTLAVPTRTSFCDSSQPCLNSGKCFESQGPNNYTCSCAIGFMGQNCEISLTDSDCLFVTCLNGRSVCTTRIFSGTEDPRCDIKIENPCIDKAPILCRLYASNKLCDNFYNDQQIKSYCPVSCNFCNNSTKTISACVDKQTGCTVLAAFNLCSKISYTVTEQCRKSCKLCA